MDAGNTMQASIFLLSLEELLVVLNSLGVGAIPGLDAGAWTELSAEQQDLTLAVAGRALEARGLAAAGEDGRFRLHRALLTAVGLCAFPRQSVLVEYWPGQDSEPQRLFGHTVAAEATLHLVNGYLHRFILLPDRETLVDQIVAACDLSAAEPATHHELTLTWDDFGRVWEAGQAGRGTEAEKALAASGVPAEAASAFVRALNANQGLSSGQVVRRSDGAVVQHAFTILHGEPDTWLVSPQSAAEVAPVVARTANRSSVRSALLGWL